jgi:hypothetical protein
MCCPCRLTCNLGQARGRVSKSRGKNPARRAMRGCCGPSATAPAQERRCRSSSCATHSGSSSSHDRAATPAKPATHPSAPLPPLPPARAPLFSATHLRFRIALSAPAAAASPARARPRQLLARSSWEQRGSHVRERPVAGRRVALPSAVPSRPRAPPRARARGPSLTRPRDAPADYMSPGSGSKRSQGERRCYWRRRGAAWAPPGPRSPRRHAEGAISPPRPQAVAARPSRSTRSPATSRRALAADRSCRSRPRTRRSSGPRRSTMARSGRRAARARTRWAPRRSPWAPRRTPSGAPGGAAGAAGAARQIGPGTLSSSRQLLAPTLHLPPPPVAPRRTASFNTSGMPGSFPRWRRDVGMPERRRFSMGGEKQVSAAGGRPAGSGLHGACRRGDHPSTLPPGRPRPTTPTTTTTATCRTS